MEEMKKDLFDLKHQERFSKEKNLCPENCSWPGWGKVGERHRAQQMQRPWGPRDLAGGQRVGAR